jgi:hypothetical protein
MKRLLAALCLAGASLVAAGPAAAQRANMATLAAAFCTASSGVCGGGTMVRRGNSFAL